jgi:hypothetical protein
MEDYLKIRSSSFLKLKPRGPNKNRKLLNMKMTSKVKWLVWRKISMILMPKRAKAVICSENRKS